MASPSLDAAQSNLFSSFSFGGTHVAEDVEQGIASAISPGGAGGIACLASAASVVVGEGGKPHPREGMAAGGAAGVAGRSSAACGEVGEEGRLPRGAGKNLAGLHAANRAFSAGGLSGFTALGAEGSAYSAGAWQVEVASARATAIVYMYRAFSAGSLVDFTALGAEGGARSAVACLGSIDSTRSRLGMGMFMGGRSTGGIAPRSGISRPGRGGASGMRMGRHGAWARDGDGRTRSAAGLSLRPWPLRAVAEATLQEDLLLWSVARLASFG